MNKLKGGGALPSRPTWLHLLKGFAGGFLGIFILSFLGQFTELPWVMAPFGASCVLLFVTPMSPFSQPRNILGGYLTAATIGLVALYTLGDSLFVLSFAVGITIVVMQLLRVVHPPAGATPLIIILAGKGEVGFDFLLTPVLIGSLVLIALASIINNFQKKESWPVYWFGFKRKKK